MRAMCPVQSWSLFTFSASAADSHHRQSQQWKKLAGADLESFTTKVRAGRESSLNVRAHPKY